MKFLSSQIFLFIFSVGFLYYLLNNPNFLPIDTIGENNWINILSTIILSLVAIFSFFSILTYLIFCIFDKEKILKKKSFRCIKYSGIITLGLLIVFVLHFFHILEITFGIPLLIVVLILLFVIL